MISYRNKLNVLHIITSMNTGGAEMMLIKLTKYQKEINHSVIVLMQKGTLSDELTKTNANVFYVNIKQGKIPSLYHLYKIIKYTRKVSPHIIQGWMYHGNLAAIFSKYFSFSSSILFWNIRQTFFDFSKEKLLTKVLIKLSIFFSKKPHKIIYNSEISSLQHEKIGYPRCSKIIIHNGFEIKTNFSKKIPYSKKINLKKVFLETGAKRILHVSRNHPMKDHRSLLLAFKNILKYHPNTYLILVGLGLDKDNLFLNEMANNLEISDRLIFLGESREIDYLLSLADLFVLSSAWGESFPNVIGEAMSHGVPCVATNIGEIENLIDDTGIVVEPVNIQQLTEAIIKILGNENLRKSLGKKAKKRIQFFFSMEQISEKYLSIYKSFA